MRKSTKLFGAVAVAGLVAAGGSAFTNSNSAIANQVHVGGYSTTTVTGADVSDIAYTYSPDRSQVDAIVFKLAVPLVAATALAEVQVGSSVSPWKPCVYDAAAVPKPTITCTFVAPIVPTVSNTNVTLVVRDNAAPLTSS